MPGCGTGSGEPEQSKVMGCRHSGGMLQRRPAGDELEGPGLGSLSGGSFTGLAESNEDPVGDRFGAWWTGNDPRGKARQCC